MFLSYNDAIKLSVDLLKYKKDLIICPNFLNINIFKDYTLCSQNAHYENDGAYTAEVSPMHLKNIGINYVLLGHSERRSFDTDEIINKKVISALNNDITPIICIGETMIDRNMNRTSEIIKKQIVKALKGVDKEKEIILAYEPRWLIGGNKTLSKDEILDTYKFIVKILKDLKIDKYKILYGGSVTDENISSILLNELDGYLIGKACCDVDSLDNIIKCIKSVK